MIDWHHWHNEPLLVGGLVLAAWLYALCVGPFRKAISPAAPFPTREAWSFYSGLVIFYLAVGSPWDQIGERYLLSAHMVQHMVIMYPAPLLVLIGLPPWLIDSALGAKGARFPLKLLFHPLTCLVVPTVVVGVWHAPFMYEWTLEDKWVHILEHLLFFVTAFLYWWPIVSPSKLFPRSPYGSRMLYIFGTELMMIPVSGYLFFSHDTLYPTYEFAPRIISGFNAHDDQMVSGIIMKVMGMFVSLICFGICFFEWSKENKPGTPAKGAKAQATR